MKDLIKLNDLEMDALREMGNIGTGNAATALSNFIGKSIDMNIPETKFLPIRKFPEEAGGAEKIVSGIYLQIEGDFKGEAVFLFPKEGAVELIDMIMGNPKGTTKEMKSDEESAFKEMSNILTGSFLSAISKMLDSKILPSVPHVATDMVRSLLDFIIVRVGRYAETVLCIKTRINVENHNINGDFFVFFDQSSLKKMLDILHKKYGPLK